MNIFGFDISRAKVVTELPSVTAPQNDDGALVVSAMPAYAGTALNLDHAAKTERDLITRYREISGHPELSSAIDDIINEMLYIEFNKPLVEINLDKLNVDPQIKEIIFAEFKEVQRLMNFNKDAYDLLKRWYVDGRVYYHAIIDPKAPQNGIQELRLLDPRKIKLIREVETLPDPVTGAMVKQILNEYFLYDDSVVVQHGEMTSFNYSNPAVTPVRIAKDAIVYGTSGLTDENGIMVRSYLHQAIKPLNQLRMMEDSAVIYRLARGAEKRMFYVQVGNMPGPKAEQFLQNMMTKHKNRTVYNAQDGTMRDDRKMMTMIEDYWFPVFGDGKATEVKTLDSGQQLGELTDVNYFKDRLMGALNIPLSRTDPNTPYVLGRAAEISRDEIKFQKFVDKLRRRHSRIFDSALEKQFALKGIMTPEEWKNISQYVEYHYSKDNFFAELKNVGLLQEQGVLLQTIEPFISTYFSRHWVKKNILNQSDEEIEQISQEQLIEVQRDLQQQMLLQQLALQAGVTRQPPAEE